jgi:hypothetical protein
MNEGRSALAPDLFIVAFLKSGNPAGAPADR